MNRRKIIEESENLGELPNYIKLPHPKKLKSEESTTLIGSCNEIFQKRLLQEWSMKFQLYWGVVHKRSSAWSW